MISRMSDADFAAYLRRVGEDYAESGNDATAEDYAEAARRIGGRQSGKHERITAADIQLGDLIARTRTETPYRVSALGTAGETARYIELAGGGRIRPRYSAKFWRVIES